MRNNSLKIKGRVWRFGDNVNTDEIIPARYLNTSDPAELAKHCMEDADPEFIKRKSAGDIIVSGKNFGCGSSREHAPLAIKGAGISAVVSVSFARIFYRNCINIGLPIVEAGKVAENAENGDIIEIDFNNRTVENISKSIKEDIPEFPEFMQRIIDAGGLMNLLKSGKNTI